MWPVISYENILLKNKFYCIIPKTHTFTCKLFDLFINKFFSEAHALLPFKADSDEIIDVTIREEKSKKKKNNKKATTLNYTAAK